MRNLVIQERDLRAEAERYGWKTSVRIGLRRGHGARAASGALGSASS